MNKEEREMVEESAAVSVSECDSRPPPMPSFSAPDYIHLRMATPSMAEECQMQLINMNDSCSTTSGSPCLDRGEVSSNGAADVPGEVLSTAAPAVATMPRISYRSGKGSYLWWRGRTTLEKLLLVALLLLVCVSVALVVLVARFAADARNAEEKLALATGEVFSTHPSDSISPSPATTTEKVHTQNKSSDDQMESPSPAQPEICTSRGCVQAAHYFMSAVNFSADPCDNFFEYACGKWNYEHPIPDDQPVHGTFSYVRDLVRQQLRVSLESDSSPSSARSVEMAKLTYRICMNTTELEALRSRPLLEVLVELGGWPVMEGEKWKGLKGDNHLTSLMAITRRDYASDTFFSVDVMPDSKNTTKNALVIDQGTLALGRGSRDYYLNETLFSAHMNAYAKYIFHVISLVLNDAGVEVTYAVNQTVANIVKIETELAKFTTPEDDRRNSTRQYNKMQIKDLYDLLPQIDWLPYMHVITPESVHDLIGNDSQIIVAEIEYLRKLSELMRKSSDRLLADYVIWRVVYPATKLLDDRFEDARHEWSRVMTGQQMRSPRWKECAQVPNNLFPLAAGAIYVHEHFNAEDKEEAVKMISNIRGAFTEMVRENEWMDDVTKDIAIEKANNMIELIGYPDLITDPSLLDEKYDNLSITPSDSYFGYMRKYMLWLSAKEFNKLRKPFDKMEFDTSPAVVNAFYSPEKNAIMFPAGILQPPFFSGSFPKAVNYGAIGAVIGHEITHGFDDQGSQYDKNGNLVNWWNEKSSDAFASRKECIVSQYSHYAVPDTNLTMNGRLTLGENIADNGGVKEAYRAYRASVEKQGKEEPRLPGLPELSNDQIFFLSYANFWCGHKTKAAATQQVLTDEHAPEIFRVIGVLSNFPAFADAFHCKVGSLLNPSKRCSVW